MRIRECAACGYHYESRARTPRKLLHLLRECGKRASSVVQRLQSVAPIGEDATHQYLAEQLQLEAQTLHEQFADRLFSICPRCADLGCYDRRSSNTAEPASARAQAALDAARAIKPRVGKLVHFAGVAEHTGQLSLAACRRKSMLAPGTAVCWPTAKHDGSLRGRVVAGVEAGTPPADVAPELIGIKSTQLRFGDPRRPRCQAHYVIRREERDSRGEDKNVYYLPAAQLVQAVRKGA